MSQKNFTSHGHPIPGAPYRPDQQPRNVARCGGPGLCPDCSREAGLGNRKNRMTTIDHQQEARVAVANTMRQIEPNLYENPANPEIYYGHLADDAIRAAAPHLRAAWEQEMAEKIKAEINDVDWDYGLNADAYLNGLRRVLALLEGGTE